MIDIKVKTTTKKPSSVKKSIKVKKIKASDKPSAAVAEDEFTDEEDEANSEEAQCLLREALNIKKACYVQEDDEQENNEDTERFQPVDQLMSSEIHNRISDYEKSGSAVEEDNQDYVVVGCRFPNGVVICLGKNKTLLRGINDMPAQEREHHYEHVGFTRVIRPVWKEFLKTHQNWPPILNGSIFVVSNQKK